MRLFAPDIMQLNTDVRFLVRTCRQGRAMLAYLRLMNGRDPAVQRCRMAMSRG